ncbi:MAG TPA: hypothetical protein ENO23_03710, partial [Alphaproteobacteria bacterium]|nr:hypothetical protein [Alphaproteobacteria bacterium]
CEKLEPVGENEYAGALNIKVGPVQGSFDGKVKLEDIRKPDSYTMRVDGQGASGFVNATGHLTLSPAEADAVRTRVAYEGDAQVGGRLAAVGQRLVESSAKAIIKQSMEGLNGAVKARTAGGEPASAAGGEPASATGPADASNPHGPSGSPPAKAATPQRPSQSAFAAGVAREVVADVIPAPVRWALALAVVAAVVYFVVAILT